MVAGACYSLLGRRVSSLLRIRIALVQFSFSVLQQVQPGFRCFLAGSGRFALFWGGSPLFQLVPLSLYNILADLLQFELFFWPFSALFLWGFLIYLIGYCGWLLVALLW